MKGSTTEQLAPTALLSKHALYEILGIMQEIPVDSRAMAKAMRITFLPGEGASRRIHVFAARLRDVLVEAGSLVLPPEEALDKDGDVMNRDRLIVIATGNWTAGDLPVDHVANLRTTTIVGVVDGPCPARYKTSNQDRLNSIIQVLAWNVVQVALFIEDEHWTICTMNGAIVVSDLGERFPEQVRTILVPKLAAAVVPPRAADFEVYEGQLNPADIGIAEYAQDFTRSGPLWTRSGVMLFHSPLSGLKFRNRRYQRIVSAFLDDRTGMSYGFLARQLAVKVKPAMSVLEASASTGAFLCGKDDVQRINGRVYAVVHVNSEMLVVEVPEVWVLTTRSGCDKTNVNIKRDLVLLGLVDGRVIVHTPAGLDKHMDCKPSYDTLTILSHAAGNALAASILLRLRRDAQFPVMLGKRGAAIAHWHGHVAPDDLPKEYARHGYDNPPVSCSTYQSAIYALTGKLTALSGCLENDIEFLGDVHIEPYHGVNVTGASLMQLAKLVLQIERCN